MKILVSLSWPWFVSKVFGSDAKYQKAESRGVLEKSVVEALKWLQYNDSPGRPTFQKDSLRGDTIQVYEIRKYANRANLNLFSKF